LSVEQNNHVRLQVFSTFTTISESHSEVSRTQQHEEEEEEEE
jgi:hypothetical protein